MRARAAVLTEFGVPLTVTEIEVAAPQEGEVMVAIAASGICGSDIKALDGGNPRVQDLPFILGHESAGVVTDVGPGVTSVLPGDHVVIAMNRPCGRCRGCARGQPYLCSDQGRMNAIMGLMADGTTRLTVAGEPARPMIGVGSFAEYAVVAEAACIQVSADVPLDLLALTACAVVTGVGAVLNTADVEVGSSVLVIGCGGVGLNVVQGAGLAGATTIIAADVKAEKLELACRFGATHTVLAGNLRDQIDSIARCGVDYAFDVTADPSAFTAAFEATRPGGTTVLVGSPPAGLTIGIAPQTLLASRRLIGTQGGDAVPARDLPLLADLYRSGRLNLEDLVSERVPLDRLNDAIGHVRSGSVARSLVVFGQP
jgi:S-(hydroxymethyl)glutathione dehydrogenase / alcohol dehydrogenase